MCFALVYCCTQFGVLCKCHLPSLPLTPIHFQIANGSVKMGCKNGSKCTLPVGQSITRLFNFGFGSIFIMGKGVKARQI